MKIRTITTGFELSLPFNSQQFTDIANSTLRIKKAYQNAGYPVQTVRITTQPWEQYYESDTQMKQLVKTMEKLTEKTKIDYFNIGTTIDPDNIPFLLEILKMTKQGFCSVSICDNKTINYEAAWEAANVLKQIATLRNDGFSNLRFAVLCNIPPNVPFYPASYHKGPPSFGIGTENSDILYKAFSASKNIRTASEYLTEMLLEEYTRIEKIAEDISKKEHLSYNGVDVSISGSVNKNGSIAYSFEKLGLGFFGGPGTLFIAALVTNALQQLKIKTCGYRGLMLPVLEDHGLAVRNMEGAYNIYNLLMYSAVCGTGLDTIPLPGTISTEKLYALLLDVASLAIKLQKPLSARLMPVPSKKRNEMTEYSFEYFVNTTVMDL